MNKVISTRNRIFISLVEPRDSRITNLIILKSEDFNPNLTKIVFYQHPQSLYDVMQKDIDCLEFVQGVHFEFINFLKNNGTKYLLIFDDSSAETCNSKEFVDIATAGRNGGFSTIYIKHNLFHQSNLGRDVELQNTHTLFLSSPLEMCIKLLN